MELRSGRLQFTPEIATNQVSPSSVDLRLSNTFTAFNKPLVAGVSTSIDLSQMDNVEDIAGNYGTETVLKAGEAFLLEPGGFVLAYTQEHIILPNYLAGRIEGRSSFARLGIPSIRPHRLFMRPLRVN
jgi:dCTP deaminase